MIDNYFYPVSSDKYQKIKSKKCLKAIEDFNEAIKINPNMQLHTIIEVFAKYYLKQQMKL